MSGLQYSVIRFYADFKNDKGKVADLISSIFCIISIIGFSGSVILISTHKIWNNLLFDRIPFFPIVLLAILISLVTALYNVYQETLKGMQQAQKSVLLSYLFFLLMLGSNIITVVVLKKGAEGILVSSFIVNLFMTILMILDLRRQQLLLIKINKDILKQLFKYSLPLVPHSLSFNISNFFTRIIINTKMTTSMLGLYSLAAQFGGVADVVSNSVQSAFQPWMFAKMNQDDDLEQNKSEICSLTNQLLWLYGLIYLLIGAFAKEAIDLMTNINYHPAWVYVPVFVMSVAIKSPLYFYQNFMYYHKELSKYLFICTATGTLISMVLVWCLIPIWGIYGAILADTFALIARLFLTMWILKDKNTLYSFTRIIITTLFSIFWLTITVFPSYILIFDYPIYNYIYKILMCLAYVSFALCILRGKRILINITKNI